MRTIEADAAGQLAIDGIPVTARWTPEFIYDRDGMFPLDVIENVVTLLTTVINLELSAYGKPALNDEEVQALRELVTGAKMPSGDNQEEQSDETEGELDGDL